MNEQSAQEIANNLSEALQHLIPARAHLMNAVNAATDNGELDALRESLRDVEGLIATGQSVVLAYMRDWHTITDERSTR